MSVSKLVEVIGSKGGRVVVGILIASAGGIWAIRWILKEHSLKKARQKWAKVGQDVVVLHQFPRPKTCLSLSPFPIKVETFLRITGIKYVNDFDFPYSPDTRKSPWITLNGEDISDSQIIVETLARKFGKDLSSQLAPKERSVSRSLRILLEDHMYWIFMIDRYVNQQARHFRDLKRLEGPFAGLHFEMYRRGSVRKLTQQAYSQGLLRVGRGNVQKMGIEDLEAISTFLGTKTFIMGGDKPTDLDCVLFGFMTTLVYTSHDNSIYKTLIEKRLTNLNQHMLRMRGKFFPDWNDLIAGKEPQPKKDPPAKPPPPQNNQSEAKKKSPSQTPSSTAKANQPKPTASSVKK